MLFVTNDAYWFVRDLQETIERPSARISATVDFSDNEETIRWLQEKDFRFGWLYIPEEIALARAYGHYLPNARLNGEIIGYIKIARHKAYVLDYEAELNLPTSDAFVYDTFVLPEHRGKRIASSLIAEALVFLRQKGYGRLWCHIPGWNAASLSAFRRSGFRRVAHVRFFKILGHRFFSVHPQELMRRAASRRRSDCSRYTPEQIAEVTS